MSVQIMVYCQIDPTGANCSETLSQIDTFSFKKMHLKISSGNWQPFFARPQCINLHVICFNFMSLSYDSILNHCPSVVSRYFVKAMRLLWHHCNIIRLFWPFHYSDVIMSAIQPFVQVQTKENIKVPRHCPLCVESTGGRWIPLKRDSNAE